MNDDYKNRMSYFDECVDGLLKYIPMKWECTSYGNDACPSYSFNNRKLFIDHPNPQLREDTDWKRFSITDDDEESDDFQMVIYQTDDFDTALNYMESGDESNV